MAPDKRPARQARSKRAAAAKVRHDPSQPYDVVFFQRHPADDPTQRVPGRAFLAACPVKVRAIMLAVLTQVAASPPHRFAGGGKWEAMHGDMTGYHEVRVDGPNRHHYRLICKLDTDAQDRGPLLVVIAGTDKPFRTKLADSVYDDVRALGTEYLARNPRSLAERPAR
jgi:hypothetical protein